jgi:RNA recognition motif-containing protein
MLPTKTSEQELGAFFANAAGPVATVKIIQDRETGRSKGFGFVRFENEETVNLAIQKCDGADMNGRQLRVNQANNSNDNQRQE